jgi:hypothetical protein
MNWEWPVSTPTEQKMKLIKAAYWGGCRKALNTSHEISGD